MELTYWTNTFSTLTMESSLLTGFSFGGMYSIAEYKGKESTLNMIYLCVTASSMGFGLCCITTASFCLLMGPGKALRAQNIEQIDEAINHLKEKSFLAFWFFVFELICFHISSFSLMWIVYSPMVAFIVNCCLLAFLLQFCSEGYEIWDRLFVDEKSAVSHNVNMLNQQKKQMNQLDADPSASFLNVNISRSLTREEQQEAAMRNMSDEEYLQFKEFKMLKEMEKKQMMLNVSTQQDSSRSNQKNSGRQRQISIDKC